MYIPSKEANLRTLVHFKQTNQIAGFNKSGLTTLSCSRGCGIISSFQPGDEVSAPKPSVKQLLGTLEYGPAPEAPTVAEAWLDDHGRSLGHFIGNQWVKPEGRKTYDTFNPATGQRLASTVQGTPSEHDI